MFPEKPTKPVKGDVWYDPPLLVWYVFDGREWVQYTTDHFLKLNGIPDCICNLEKQLRCTCGAAKLERKLK